MHGLIKRIAGNAVLPVKAQELENIERKSD
jgi:hypothetical protein